MSDKPSAALDRLESQIERARELILKLRQENLALTGQLEEMEQTHRDTADQASLFSEERAELKRRVESIAEGLEELLDTPT